MCYEQQSSTKTLKHDLYFPFFYLRTYFLFGRNWSIIYFRSKFFVFISAQNLGFRVSQPEIRFPEMKNLFYLRVLTFKKKRWWSKKTPAKPMKRQLESASSPSILALEPSEPSSRSPESSILSNDSSIRRWCPSPKLAWSTSLRSPLQSQFVSISSFGFYFSQTV